MLLNPRASTSSPAIDSSTTPHPAADFPPRLIQPIGAYVLQGLVSRQQDLIAVDTVRGYLLQVNPQNGNATVLNPLDTEQFLGCMGLALLGDKLWFTHNQYIYTCSLSNFNPTQFATLLYEADGIAVCDSTVYVSSQRAGYIYVFDGNTGRQITRFHAPGIGVEFLTVRGEELWVSDNLEQTVYCMDRATGEVRFSLLTPFSGPAGLAFLQDATTSEETLYVVYTGEEPYVRDNPSLDPPRELAVRDRTFIHPLYFHYYQDQRYTLSNGYLVEMCYVEEMLPLDDVHLENVEWRIALPAETDRQKVRKVEAIGLPFTEEIQDGQRVAVFKFEALQPGERHIFGWKAQLELWSIKYQLTPRELEKLPPLSDEMRAAYLQDDDELAMDTPTIQQAAQEAIGTETNILRKMLKIRNYVYDRLSYSLTTMIEPPDVALERGIGSCGEYLGVLLALARLNGIACRTVGRYKCPLQPGQFFVPLLPEYNHVWLEFYVPGFGWLPMESNPDDIIDNGPYPTRFFMGLSWYHTEVAKGISFEKLFTNPETEDTIGDLAINHVQFTVLAELRPTA